MINSYFKWESESSGENGEIEINSKIAVEPPWQQPLQTALLVFVILSLLVFTANRLWGVDSQRP